MKYDFEVIGQSQHTPLIDRLRTALSNHHMASGEFTWSETPQGTAFWSAYAHGKNQTEGKAALREMIAQLEAEQKPYSERVKDQISSGQSQENTELDEGICDEWGDWIKYDCLEGMPFGEDIQESKCNGKTTHYRIRKNTKRAAPDFTMHFSVDLSSIVSGIFDDHTIGDEWANFNFIYKNGKYSVEVVE